MQVKAIEQAVRAALAKLNLNPYRAAVEAGLPPDAVRHLFSGHEPKAGRLAEICNALGLEFYVGPPRGAEPALLLRAVESKAQALNRVVVDAGGDPIPQDLWSVLDERRGMVPIPSDMADSGALTTMAANDAGAVAGARPVDIVELGAAAGGGADAASEEVTGCVWFRRDWLDRQGLNPTQCVVIGVEGESMEPTLVEGSSILVDRSRRRRRAGRVYVVRTDDGLIVKRAGKGDDGGWLLVSDHPTWKPIRWPGDAETVGQVMWTARTLKW